MLQADEQTSFMGVAELRKNTPGLLREMQKHKVVLTRRNKPVGVVLSYEEFKKMDEALEQLEDKVLAQTVKERLKHKNPKFVSLEEAERRLGLK